MGSSNRTLLADYIQGVKTPRNFCLNPGAENNTSNITDANSIVSRDTTTVLDGEASFAINAGASGEKALFLAAPFTKGTQGHNCEASFDYTGPAALYKVYAQLDTRIVSNEENLVSISSGSQHVIINFPCGVSDTDVPAFVVEATDAAAAEFQLDNIYIGKATNVGSVAQASEIGTASYALTASCLWSTTSASLASFSADADCPAASVTGQASTPATKIPGITFASLPAGSYEIVTTGYFGPSNLSPNAEMRFVLSDGTTQNGVANANQQGTSSYSSSSQIVSRFSYTTAQSDITFQIQGRTNNASNAAAVVNDTVTPALPLSFIVRRFPTASEQVMKIGAPGSTLTAFTSVLTGETNGLTYTNQTSVGNFSCSGGYIDGHIQTAFTGAPGTGTGIFNYTLPTGIVPATGAGLAAGWARPVTGGGNNLQPLMLVNTSGVLLRLSGLNAVGTAGNVSPTFPATFQSGDVISTRFRFPVTADSPCASASMPLVKHAVTMEYEGTGLLGAAKVSCDATPSVDQEVGDIVTTGVYNGTGDCTWTFNKTYAVAPI